MLQLPFGGGRSVRLCEITLPEFLTTLAVFWLGWPLQPVLLSRNFFYARLTPAKSLHSRSFAPVPVPLMTVRRSVKSL